MDMIHSRPRRQTLAAAAACCAAGLCTPFDAKAEDTTRIDEVSVTATREERPTKDVPLSISVIGQDRIEAAKMMNIKDAVQGTPGVQIDSNNGGYDTRLLIRGAGVNAQYGVREIMVLRDGVPVTDPNSFTTFDWIDTQDIERIEVVKGPGSVLASGSAGGTIQILSKSVFDEVNLARIGLGGQGAQNTHARWGTRFGDGQAIAVTGSRRVMDPSWRAWNRFEDDQAGIKYGMTDSGGGVLETEIGVTNARLQLPGTMTPAQFSDYRRSGKQTGRSDAFVTSERNSEVQTFNMKYEREIGDLTLKPRAYFTHWSQFHPVTGMINSSDGNYVFGTDVEADLRHTLFGLSSTLVSGLSLRGDLYLDAKKYLYRDYRTDGSGRITQVLSDAEGALAERDNTKNYQAGVFAEDNLAFGDRWSLDFGGRYDIAFLELDQNEMTRYDYALGKYTAGAGYSYTQPTFNLFSPKAGLTYKVTPQLSAYLSAAQADQVPAASQILTNFQLSPAHATNAEFGLKLRAQAWSFDAATYYELIRNDIVSAVANGQTVYQNAGRTERKGVELGTAYTLRDGLKLGGTYTYSDYHYLKFEEAVGGLTVSRDGNRVPSIPINAYSLFAEYRGDTGLRARLQTVTMGDYQMDSANTMRYGGYSFVTNAMLGYEFGPHTVAVNVDNLFNQTYSVDAKKDATGKVTYAGAAPFSALATYTVKF